jgi:hypothetical protein
MNAEQYAGPLPTRLDRIPLSAKCVIRLFVQPLRELVINRGIGCLIRRGTGKAAARVG